MKWLLLATVICAAVLHASSQATKYNGTEFYLMFMPNTVEAGIPPIDYLSIIVSNPDDSRSANVFLTTNERRLDDVVMISSLYSHVFTIPYDALHDSPGLDNKGVKIKSTIPVTVTGGNSLEFSTDTFLVIPVAGLGVGYTAACYDSNINTQIGIVAVLNSTIIIITLPPEPVTEGRYPVENEHAGILYSYDNRLEVRMDAGESFLLSVPGDLTGTTLKSSKRIAVFSGNVRTKANGTTRDHLVEQMLPFYAWGNTYLTTYVHPSRQGAIYRILAKEPATEITVKLTGAENRNIDVLVLNPAEFRQLELAEDVDAVFTSSKSIYVYKVMKSVQKVAGPPAANLSDRYGDPSLSSLSSTRYWRSFYVFFFPVKVDGSTYENYITIFTLGEYSVTLDGSFVPNIQYSKMADGYYTTVIYAGRSSSGYTHTLRLSGGSGDEQFGVVLTGFADRESYSHALGFDLMRSPECLVGRALVPGDVIDNDCDSFVDEEESNGLDDDNDGLIDEDLGVGRSIVSSGRHYLFMFMENTVEQVNNVPMEVFIGGLETVNQTNITVEYPIDGRREFFSFHLFPQEVCKMEFNHTIMQRGTGLDKKAVRVSADKDIVVYGMNKEQFSADGFLALPVTTLGKEYYTVCYSPATMKTEFAIIGTKNGTNVTITLPPLAHATEVTTVNFNGQTYENDQSFWMILNELDTLQIQANHKGDLSGTYIKATESIAVFSGNVRTAVDGASRDHLVEQLPPLVSFGTKFATMTTPERTVGDVYKLTAAHDNTTIEYCQRIINGDNPVNLTCNKALLEFAGHHVNIDVTVSNVFMYIEASKPVLVVQITRSQYKDPAGNIEHGDPAMIIIPPIEQYGANHTFLTPTTSTPLVGTYRFHWLMVIIDRSETSGLLVDADETAFVDTVWQPIPNTTLVGGYINVPFALHTLTHMNSKVRYMGLLYGVADRESYGFPIGLKLNDLGVCTPVSQTSGDKIDNDCDGRVDEEYCGDGIDNDLDGEIDEDCTRIPNNYKYVLGYMENMVESPLGFPLRLYASTSKSQHVRVRTPAYRYKNGRSYDNVRFVNASLVVNLGFRTELRHTSTGVDTKGIVVETEFPIRFYGSNKERYSHDTFRVLEKGEAGTEYVIMMYSPSLLQEEFMIVPFSDNTSITITLSRSLSSPIEFEGNSYGANSKINNLALNDGYTVLIQSEQPTLAGTRVNVDNNLPIAVFSGNVRTIVGPSRSRDHLVETMLPVKAWVNTYYLPTTPDRTVSDSVLIISRHDTSLKVLSNSGGINTYNLTAYVQCIIEVETNGRAYRFTANHPFQIARVTSSQLSFEELADPSMMMIMPQPVTKIYFVPPTYSGGDMGGEYKNTVQIVMDSSKTYGIVIDNKETKGTTWTPIHTTGHSVANFHVNNEQKAKIIMHKEGVSFFAYAYGSADRESYAMPL